MADVPEDDLHWERAGDPDPRPWDGKAFEDPWQQLVIRSIVSDGVPVWQLQCPGCGGWGDIDDDQLHGRVSVDHTGEGCTYHETHDYWTEATIVHGARKALTGVETPSE